MTEIRTAQLRLVYSLLKPAISMAARFHVPQAASDSCTLNYTFAHVLARTPGMMEGLGFKRPAAVRLAA